LREALTGCVSGSLAQRVKRLYESGAAKAVSACAKASYQPTPESRRGGAREVTANVRGVVDVSIQGSSSAENTRRVELSKRREALLAKQDRFPIASSRRLRDCGDTPRTALKSRYRTRERRSRTHRSRCQRIAAPSPVAQAARTAIGPRGPRQHLDGRGCCRKRMPHGL